MSKYSIQYFLEIEKKYHLFDKKIDGVNYWIYNRNDIYEAIRNQLDPVEPAQDPAPRSFIKDLKRFACSLYFYIISASHAHPADIVIFSHSRRIWNATYYEDIYTDYLTAHFNTLTIEEAYMGNHLRPTYTRNLFYLDMADVKFELYYLYKRFIRPKKYYALHQLIANDLSAPIAEMEHAYGISLNHESIFSTVTFTILWSQSYCAYFRKLLRKIKPHQIIEVVSYNIKCQCLNEAAHSLHIPVTELQHGAMEREQAAFQFAENYNIPQLPDNILTFSDYWSSIIHVPTQINVIATGYPYFEKQLALYSNQPTKQDKINILFISQGTIGKELSKLAYDLSLMLDSNKYQILYKMHPGEFSRWETEYSYLKDTNITILADRRHSIYEYFVISKIQVGVSSTAIYEGLGFNLKTFIYNIADANELFELINQKYATYITSADELRMHIISSFSENVSSNSPTPFWKSNAESNVCHFINKSK